MGGRGVVQWTIEILPVRDRKRARRRAPFDPCQGSRAPSPPLVHAGTEASDGTAAPAYPPDAARVVGHAAEVLASCAQESAER